MFRIDRNMVRFERKESVYTNLGQTPQPQPQTGVQHQEETALQKSKEALKKAQTDLMQMELESRQRAERLLTDAKAQTETILQKAQADARGILESARKEGYTAGLQKADAEIEERCRQKTDRLELLISSIEETRKTMLDELEEDIISLVMEAAKKVINIKLEKDDKVFEGIIQNALAQMKREEKIVIRVSPEDYRRYFPDGSAEYAVGGKRILASVTEESLFRPGDCVIESEGDTINVGIDSQLKYIELSLRSEKSGGL